MSRTSLTESNKSFMDYLETKVNNQKAKDLETEANPMLWAQIQSEVNYQDSSPFIPCHFGKLANSIKQPETESLTTALVYAVAFRLTYGLAELQEKHQMNQRHAEAEKALNRIGQYKISLWHLTTKDVINRLTKAFSDKYRNGVADTASCTLMAIKTANEPTLVQLANSLLGDTK